MGETLVPRGDGRGKPATQASPLQICGRHRYLHQV